MENEGMNRNYIEKEGASPREAFLKALLEMGALEEEVEYTIEEVLYKGFFGTTKKAYRCRLWLKSTSKEEAVLQEPVIVPHKTYGDKGKVRTSNPRLKATSEGQSMVGEFLRQLDFTYEEIKEFKTEDGFKVLVYSDDPGRLIGKDGHILLALNRVLSTFCFRKYGKSTRIVLDINDYLKKKEKKVIEQAIAAIGRVKQSRRKLELKPMNSWERRIVHQKAQEAGVTSLSRGSEPYRRVVLSLENVNKHK